MASAGGCTGFWPCGLLASRVSKSGDGRGAVRKVSCGGVTLPCGVVLAGNVIHASQAAFVLLGEAVRFWYLPSRLAVVHAAASAEVCSLGGGLLCTAPAHRSALCPACCLRRSRWVRGRVVVSSIPVCGGWGYHPGCEFFGNSEEPLRAFEDRVAGGRAGAGRCFVVTCQRRSNIGSGTVSVIAEACRQSASRMRLRSRSGLARPYICLLIILMRLTCPSTRPEFQGSVRPAVTASWSRRSLWGVESRPHCLTCGYAAAGSYSLIRPPRTGRRRIEVRPGSAVGWSGRGGVSCRAWCGLRWL